MIERAYSKIEPHLNDFMGGVFEEICKQWLWRKNRKGALPIEFTDLGRWWGNNPHKREEAELDILAADGKTAALFAECKWKNENIDVTVLDTLIERSKLFSYPKICFYIFAKNGFTKSCIEKAKDMGNVTLVCFEDMINI
jgi:AAA+ ATPase superfamily predicted ATPase